MRNPITMAAVLTAPIPTAFAQNLSSYNNGSIRVPSICSSGFLPGSDVALFTVPYPYSNVMSVIGSYRNLTWSGSPPSTVHLNGTDNTPGTARTYLFGGATLVETINHYSKPPAPGPYVEIHTTAMTHYPSLNLSAYIPWDGTVVTSVCDGRASQFNFTASFCANNVSTAAAVLHEAHISDAITVGVMLGGHNYTGCAALGVDEAAGPANATAANGTATASASSSATASASGGDSTGGGNHLGSGSPFAVLLAAIVFGVAMSG